MEQTTEAYATLACKEVGEITALPPDHLLDAVLRAVELNKKACAALEKHSKEHAGTPMTMTSGSAGL